MTVPMRVLTAPNFDSWKFDGHKDLPEGVWQDEPDKVQWVDPETDLDCLIVRNRGGALCGYVGVGPDHPFHGRSYENVDVDVHGGLTFAEHCAPGEPIEGICHRAAPGRPDPVWWLGFDCAHAFDVSPRWRLPGDIVDYPEVYRDMEFVVGECEGLAKQLVSA